MKVYGFGVVETLPIIDIPLDEDDTIRVDFGALYHLTFNSLRLYRNILVDYSREPVNFAAYSAADQTLIRQYIHSLTNE